MGEIPTLTELWVLSGSDGEVGRPYPLHAADPWRVGQHGLEVAMDISPRFEIHREPVSKRVVAAAVMVDDA